MKLKIPCKTGSIQIDNEGTIIKVVQLGRLLWQANTADVTAITVQPGQKVGWITALNVTIHATTGTYLAETVTKQNYEKLQACFPHLAVGSADQPWYLQPARSHVATYSDQNQMTNEIGTALANGWEVLAQTPVGGNVSARKIIAGEILAGPLGALAGAGRSKQEIMVTFGRTAQWIETHQ